MHLHSSVRSIASKEVTFTLHYITYCKVKYEVTKLINFKKVSSYSIINILTHQKPDSYSALASSLVWVGRSDDNYYRPTGRPILARAE